jgi:Protein of unknown function, DUF417
MEDTQKHCTGGEIKKTRQPSSMGLIIRQKEPTNLETPLTLVPANVEWNEKNQTYAFAYGLGAVIVLYALMLCLHPWLPHVAALGGFLVFVMSLVRSGCESEGRPHWTRNRCSTLSLFVN